jgi:hypothetical protein
MHLPTEHLVTPPAHNVRSVGYSIQSRGGQWAVVRSVHFIDRHGEDDCYADDVSIWPTEAEAHAEIVATHAALRIPVLRPISAPVARLDPAIWGDALMAAE